MAAITRRDEIIERLAEIDSIQIPIEHNEGTWSGSEAVATVGTADPNFANYTIYGLADGSRRVVGCDPTRAPGRAIRSEDAARDLARLRAERQALRDELGRLDD